MEVLNEFDKMGGSRSVCVWFVWLLNALDSIWIRFIGFWARTWPM